MPIATPLTGVVDDTAQAARSKLSHRDRVAAAEKQRDRGFVLLHDAGWSYSAIERALREALAKQGLTDEQIDACGISHHNVRRAIREARESR